jgi:alpha-galactosidase
MIKITFMGAGSTVFAKNILGDCMLSEALCSAHYTLYDIDARRLRESHQMLEHLNNRINDKRAKISTHLGVENRRVALRNSDFVVNAIQVGGYKPATVLDFKIPKKYGLRQTIGDTLGIGGIFRALRTIPVCLEFARELEQVAPDAWFLNYVNPMAMITGALLHASNIKTVGLCHSVQGCASGLLKVVGMMDRTENLRWKIAGINHQAWLLEITDGKMDLYPEIKRRAERMNLRARKKGATKHNDMVRFEIMRQFGFYVTESSEHNAEYMPYWIKNQFPHLIEEFNIPLDEYPRRCIAQIKGWKQRSKELVHNKMIDHQRTDEYGSNIMESMMTNQPFHLHGNILNNGFIPDLPSDAVVEVPCLADGNGVQGCYVGNIPEQLAALNRTNINVQLLTIEAALTRKKDTVYHAAMMDPHTAAELPLDTIRAMCDDLLEAHGMTHLYK